MSLVSRRFEDKDYLTVASWWLSREWSVIPQELLPETGFIVDGIAAGWLYKTDSKFAMLEWVISNPATEQGARAEALDLIIEGLLNEARTAGYKMIFTSLNNRRLIDRYKAHGFMSTDEGITNMIARIN